jgi:hypothetical protein
VPVLARTHLYWHYDEHFHDVESKNPFRGEKQIAVVSKVGREDLEAERQ